MTTAWDVASDDELELDEFDDSDFCDRCHAPLTKGHCTDVEVRFPGFGASEWFWCDDCADAFTAWRLAKEDVIVRERGLRP